MKVQTVWMDETDILNPFCEIVVNMAREEEKKLFGGCVVFFLPEVPQVATG